MIANEKQSAPHLMKKLSETEIIRAIESYEQGVHKELDALDNAHSLRHASMNYPPTTIIALASEFIENGNGRRLETRDFKNFSQEDLKFLRMQGSKYFQNQNHQPQRNSSFGPHKTHIPSDRISPKEYQKIWAIDSI